MFVPGCLSLGYAGGLTTLCRQIFKNVQASLRDSVQGGPSGQGIQFVEIK